VPLKLKGSTSGSVELDVPAVVGGDVSLELPGGGTVDRLDRAGNILQVVSASTSTQVVNSTVSYVDTGLTATITPTNASSKVLVLIAQQYYYTRTSNVQGIGIRIYRDATLIYDPISNATGPVEDYLALGGNVTSTTHYSTFNRSILDSPNTTSAVTYKTQGRPYLTTGSTGFQPSNVVNGTSIINLIEVAA